MSRWNLCGCCLWSCHWGSLKRAWTHLWILPSGVYNTFIRYPKSVHFSRLNSPNSLRLSSYLRCFSPLIIIVILCCALSSMCMPLLCWVPRRGHNTPGMASPVLNKRKRRNTQPPTEGTAFLKKPKMPFSLPSEKGVMLAQVELYAHKNHMFLSVKWFPTGWPLEYIGTWHCFYVQNFAFLLVELHKIPFGTYLVSLVILISPFSCLLFFYYFKSYMKAKDKNKQRVEGIYNLSYIRRKLDSEQC